MKNYTAKAQTLFLAISAATTALAATDALAVTDLVMSPDYSTEEYKYAGENPRDVEVALVDSSRSFSFNSFFPSVAASGDVPKLWELFEAFGASSIQEVGVKATSTNSTESTDDATIVMYKHSTSDTHKKVISEGARGTTDLTIELGKRAMFKCELKGSYTKHVAVAAADKVEPDYATQKAGIAPRVLTDNISTLKLQPTGEAAVDNNNVCFGKLEASNVYGFDLAREQTSCVDGYSLVAKESEVKLLIKEGDVGEGYNPEDFIEKHHSFELIWGTADHKQTVRFTDLILKTISPSTLGPWAGYELVFSAIGTAAVEVS